MAGLGFQFRPDDVASGANLDAALALARAGMAVFPCQPDKRPAPGLLWRQRSTTDEREVVGLWRRWPDALPGVDLAKTPWCAIDLDGAKGEADWRALKPAGEADPPSVTTPSGGRHLFFRRPRGIGNGRGALPAKSEHEGIDIRGEGGYVIGVGAVLRDGRAYVGDLDALVAAPALPAWLETILRGERQHPEPPAKPAAPVVKLADARIAAYVESALRDECAAVASAPKGQRNQALNRSAFVLGQMVGAGWIDEATVREHLVQAARASGLVKDDSLPATLKTIASGLGKGRKQPRQEPEDHRAELAQKGAEIARRLVEHHDGSLIDGDTGEVVEDGWPTPLAWSDLGAIPRRRWVYNSHYIRRFVSATIAPGGVGKSSLTIVEALAIASGRSLLGVVPQERGRVWLWNGEDPTDELWRRIKAACIHYGIERSEIEGRLFVNSGRTVEIVLATMERTQVKVARPMVDALVSRIRARSIDVVIVDPFISSHRVSENDNMAIDAVVKQWAAIADATNAAVELVHHARKGTGNEVTVDDARGASALLSAARSARALNGMTKDEAATVGVKTPWLFFRADTGKSNLAPAPGLADWFKLESVSLGNGDGGLIDNSDKVGVVTPWEWPSEIRGLLPDQLAAVLERLREGSWREDNRSPQWAGIAIAEVLDFDPNDKLAKQQIGNLIKQLVRDGALRIVEGEDNKRMKRNFVMVVG